MKRWPFPEKEAPTRYVKLGLEVDEAWEYDRVDVDSKRRGSPI